MSAKKGPLNLPVVEWSPRGIRTWTPADSQVGSYESLQQLNGRIAGPVILALARDTVFTKVLSLPEGNEEDIRHILQLQLENHFPVPASEAAFGFLKCGEKSGSGVPYFVAVVPAETLRSIHAQLAENGMRSEWTVPTAIGSLALSDNAVVVDPMQGRHGLDVVKNGAVVLSRIVPTGSDLSDEVRRSQALAEVQGLPTVQAQGGQSPLHALSGMIPDLRVSLPEQIAQAAKSVSDRYRRVSLMLVAAAVMVGLWIGDERLKGQDAAAAADKAWATKLKSLDDEKKLDETRANTLIAADKSLQLGFEPAQKLTDALVVMSNLAPEGLWLTGVTMERGKPVQVRGTALKPESVTVFYRNLNEQQRFSDVKLLFSNSGQIEDTDIVQFSMTLHMVGNLPLDSEVLKS